MKRREFITLLGAAAATSPVAGWAALASEASGQRGDAKLRAPGTHPEPDSSARTLASEASGQRGDYKVRSERMPRMGILLFAEQDREVIKPCLQELEALGYVDGKTVTIEYRDAQGDYERLPELAAELVKLGPDVIFSFGGEQAPIVKQATASIPIVVVVSNDPVASGLVTSLARPGGNVTGVTYVHDQLAGKTIELLRDAAPSVSRVAILWNPNHTDPEFRETQRAAQALQMQLQSLEVRQPADFEGALQAAARERAEALIVVGSRIIFLHRQRIGDFAAKNRLILVGTPKWLSSVGAALLTYGPNPVELQRRAASYVSKILKGAKPADLPMQQPATFELVLNMKTARALGLEVPPTLIARADEVIE
jgi:putative ABC transport system substrate-binding protein